MPRSLLWNSTLKGIYLKKPWSRGVGEGGFHFDDGYTAIRRDCPECESQAAKELLWAGWGRHRWQTEPCACSAGQWRFQDDSRLGLWFSDGIQAKIACGSAQRAGPWVTEIPKTLRGDGVPSSSPGPGRASAPQSSRNQGGTDGCRQQTPLPRGLRAWFSQTAHGTAPLTPNRKWLPAVGRGCPSLLCPPHSPSPLGRFLLISNWDKGRDPSIFACQTKVVQAPGFKSRGGAITVKKNNHFSSSNF